MGAAEEEQGQGTNRLWQADRPVCHAVLSILSLSLLQERQLKARDALGEAAVNTLALFHTVCSGSSQIVPICVDYMLFFL